jgi:hypothetical protein
MSSNAITHASRRVRQQLICRRLAQELPLNMLDWTLAMPLLSLGLRFLDQHRILAMSGSVVAAGAPALVLWAALIYARCVPATPELSRRIGYFVGFFAAMLALGAGALWLTFWAIVAIYGL